MYKIFILVFLSFTPLIMAADTVDDTWSKALKFYEDAEKRIRKGDNSEAIVLLNTTIETLREIQYNYPKWNPSVVRSRMQATTKRVEDVEKLILSSLSGLNKEQLLEKLKETQVSKAKFSKAMMIFYDQLKDTQETLRLKTKDLEEAQAAASKKITDQAHLDRMSFENLKMKKSLEEKSAQIKDLQARLNAANKDMGAKKLQEEYEAKLLELSKQSKELETERQDFLREKKRIAESYKEMSFKYQDVIVKEKDYEDNLDKMKDAVSSLKKQLTEEQAVKKKFVASSENLANKLELASKRIIELEAAEKKLTAAISDLQKGKTVESKMQIVDKTPELTRRINYLEKVEIDLKSKLDAALAESEKNKKLLNSYMEETGPERKKNRELEEQLAVMKKAISNKDADDKVKNTQMISMSSEIVSLKAQLKLQSNIVESMKKRLDEKKPELKKEEKVAGEMDASLLKAYEKSEAELKARLHLAEKQLSQLEKRNEMLKKENLLGDEEMIRKYVQVRDELKNYKEKTKKLYSKFEREGKKDAIMEAAFSEDERKEIERQEKLKDLLFRAQKAENAENFQAALGLYTEVLHLDPKNYSALFRIGIIHYNRRHFQDASVHLKKAFYQEPDDEHLLLALGLSYLEQDKIEMAVSYLSRLVGLRPDNAVSRLQLGVALQGLGWTEAAFDQLKKACELDENNGEAAFNLAMVSLALPEPRVKFAKEHYDRAVKLGVVRDSQLEKYFEQYKDN